MVEAEMVDESTDGSEARGGMPGLCLRKLRSPDQPWGKARKPSAVSPVKRGMEALDQLMGEADTEDRIRALVRTLGWELPLAGACATRYSL